MPQATYPGAARATPSPPIWSCSEWGLPCRVVLPPARCALTAPFHPYRRNKFLWRYIFCGTFRRLTPPRCYLALCPMEPGLSSEKVRPKFGVTLPATARPTPNSTISRRAERLALTTSLPVRQFSQNPVQNMTAAQKCYCWDTAHPHMKP